MARRGQRRFPRKFQEDTKAFREAYEEAYPGFYDMDRESLRRQIAEWDHEESFSDWPPDWPRRQLEAEEGRRLAARDAELVRKYESWSKERLQSHARMYYYDYAARWVCNQRFPRKVERPTSTRRTNGYH
jgi:hypothetical protein